MRKVEGVGVNDMRGKWRCSHPRNQKEAFECRVYTLWKGMLHRCYNKQSLTKFPTYVGCYVCDRWLTFSNFIKDLPNIVNYQLWLNNPNNRVALDKDIILPGNKEYSLNTTMFVDMSTNNLERVNRCGTPCNNVKSKGRRVRGVSVSNPLDIVEFESTRDAGRAGFSQASVSRCCRGEQHSHKGYYWEYVL